MKAICETPALKRIALLVALCCHASVVLAQAAATTDNTETVLKSRASGAQVAGVRSYSQTFKQLGAAYPFQLRGIQHASGVNFGIRADEVVTGARLHLNYSYSPSLLANISHIRVLVNEQVVKTLPVPNESGGRALQTTVDIPPRLITEFNHLSVELIGHYTMECEDPANSTLWANVGNDSAIELTVNSLALPNDLSLLPEPFFDRRDARGLELPFVFARTPDAGQLQAAGAVSSWLGALAGFRGATFPSMVGQLPPKGSAIVFMQTGESVPGVTAPATAGASVSMMTHPSDPTAKLLVISGANIEEMKRAATAVSVGSSALSGASAAISDIQQLEPRKPYDAPNWLAIDRPVKFGELAQPGTLNVSGYSPDLIRVNFQIPPDLFGWRQHGIPVDLKYRYTSRPKDNKSTLNFNVNHEFLTAVPLRPLSYEPPGAVDRVLNRLMDKTMPIGDMLPAQTSFRIPLFKLPARSQLQFHYYHDVDKEGACKGVTLDNVRGTVEPDSTIDISGFSHYLAMPDLSAFGNSGFPFTRMADLSQSAVVLPEKPEAADYGAYLSLMGLMGNVTGYPVHAVTVALGAAQVQSLADKDLLLIGAVGKQPLLTQWAEHLPFSLTDGSKRFRLSDYASRLLTWWDPEQKDRERPGQSELKFNSSSNDAVIAGFESPLQSGRSVVVLTSNQSSGLGQAVKAMLDPDLVKHLQGSAAIIRGKQVDSLVADQTYHIGKIDKVTFVRWWFSSHPLLLVAVGAVSALIIGLLMYLVLRARARARLKRQNA